MPLKHDVYCTCSVEQGRKLVLQYCCIICVSHKPGKRHCYIYCSASRHPVSVLLAQLNTVALMQPLTVRGVVKLQSVSLSVCAVLCNLQNSETGHPTMRRGPKHQVVPGGQICICAACIGGTRSCKQQFVKQKHLKPESYHEVSCVTCSGCLFACSTLQHPSLRPSTAAP